MGNISDITVYQIENMQHAIGFDKSRVTGIKHRVMHCYRNYFCTDKDDKNWLDLVERGLARMGIPDKNGIVYFGLTGEGFKFLANLCGLERMYEID
ncbi:hypothetical protein [Anaerotignum sp.]|uniref:hypothetical protein n=1 Tax=Anaerotignum sp. TaxID=2039241 RepID=UPI0028B25001|nr:hypothetical protein [Anaerotignum sp.]